MARVVDDNGDTVPLAYRATNNPDNANFGRGNGVVLSVIASGEELRDAVGDDVVTRIFEIEPNKIIVLFASLPAIHLLEAAVVRGRGRPRQQGVLWSLSS